MHPRCSCRACHAAKSHQGGLRAALPPTLGGAPSKGLVEHLPVRPGRLHRLRCRRGRCALPARSAPSLPRGTPNCRHPADCPPPTPPMVIRPARRRSRHRRSRRRRSRQHADARRFWRRGLLPAALAVFSTQGVQHRAASLLPSLPCPSSPAARLHASARPASLRRCVARVHISPPCAASPRDCVAFALTSTLTHRHHARACTVYRRHLPSRHDLSTPTCRPA
jgi:hypothetical protein